MAKIIKFSVWSLLFLLPMAAQAQGLLVNVDSKIQRHLPRPMPHPRPTPHITHSYHLEELKIEAWLKEQVATVQISQTFRNTGRTTIQASFVFPLPADGAIDRMTLYVDGKELPGKLLDAKKARAIYESIVRQNQDPALLQWLGHGMFQTSVFPIPAGKSRTVSLRYTQLCKQHSGMVDFLFPLSTAQYTTKPVKKVSINISIESATPLKNVYSPSHIISLKRPDNQHATIKYEGKNEIPATDFRLLYDISKGAVGAKIISYRPDKNEEGYWLLLASTEIKKEKKDKLRKTIIFVVDRSGSMSGKKIQQAKEALKFVLNNLHDGDLFNIVAYDDKIELFQPELQKYSDETRKKALGFVNGIHAGGGTNIDGGLTKAMAQLKDNKLPNYIIFLTDGLPTAGEQNESKIVQNAKTNNKVRARLFSFGVGFDVNSRLLDKLVNANFGQSTYVRPNEDLESSLSKFYAKIDSPALTNVTATFAMDDRKTEQGSLVSRVYPTGTFDLFAGQQLVMVGRYNKSGKVKLTIAGKAGEKSQAYSFDVEFAKYSGDESNGFVEKLWAMRRIGELIDQIDLKGKNAELTKELVALSTKHGILTPYTSFLADESTELADVTGNAAKADGDLKELNKNEGEEAFTQRNLKQQFKNSINSPNNNGYLYGKGGRRLGRATTVRHVGNRCFYKKKGVWMDSVVSLPKNQKKSTKEIKRFSKEYFALSAKYGKQVNAFLAMDESVTFELAGEIYLVK